MGLLDTPLVSEMDEVEKKAKKGDDAALEMILAMGTSLGVRRVRSFQAQGLPLREAMEKAGVAIVCIR